MEKIKTKLDGVWLFKPNVFEDERGQFIKVYNQDYFSEEGLSFRLTETYYSTSKKGVIRGMHFQIPPKDHEKIIYVQQGAITDVSLDLRRGSPTFGKYAEFELSAKNHQIVYISKGFAHGFLALEPKNVVVYLQSSGYSKEHDRGIKFNSFGKDWDIKDPILSERDLNFPPFEEFESPFIFKK